MMVEIIATLLWLAKMLVPVAVSLYVVLVLKPVVFLKRDEQILLEKPSDKETRNGPGVVFFMPILSKATVRKATLLEDVDYIVVTDSLSGVQRVEVGPKLVFVGAYEAGGPKSQKHVLDDDEYIKVRDSQNGELRVVLGPGVFVPTPTESTPDGKKKKHVLAEDEYMKVRDSKTGGVRIVVGPFVFVPTPTESMPDGKKKGISLKAHEYVRITDTSKGSVRIEKGEQLVFPGPMDVMEDKKAAWKLRRNEYIKLVDTATGEIRVEKGEQIVFPTPTEDTRAQEQYATVTAAVEVNDESAVLVESKASGQQRLVQDIGMFFPGPHDEVLDVRKLIRVEPHEVAIVQNSSGEYTFKGGDNKGAAFFLPPHCELVTMYWGSAQSPDEVANHQVASGKKTVSYKVPITKIDTRPQYMCREFSVRTSDNVELILDATIFWQVVDVPKMIQTTGDPKGDVCFHAHGYMIQAVSRVTLEVFMADFNDIAIKAAGGDDAFYTDRGVKLHALEVTRYECADSKTSAVLQEIIQETTNRINRMQKQHSDNDVQREKMIGEIEVEKQRTALVQARCDNDRVHAITEGESEGLRIAKTVSSFFSVLSDTVPDHETRLELFRTFQEQQQVTKRTEHLSTGNAQLFLTPADMNLKLKMNSPNSSYTMP